MNRFDPSRRDFQPYGLTCERWTPTPMRRTDRHNEIEVNFLPAGSLTYLLGGRRATIPAGRIGLFWAAIPHQIVECEGEEEYFVITLPFAWFLQCQFPARLLQPILHAEMLIDPCPAGSDAECFGRWFADLSANQADRRQLVLLEVQARLLRLGLSLPETPAGRRRAEHGPLDRAEGMAMFIAQNYGRELSVEDIAESAGLHPNYAMGLFKRLFGTTLNSYLTQHRLMHAQRLLATTGDTILDIAMASGFSSISRFNAVFRQACGCSPRQYRQAHALHV